MNRAVRARGEACRELKARCHIIIVLWRARAPTPQKTATPATSRHEGRPLDAASTPTLTSLVNLPSSCRLPAETFFLSRTVDRENFSATIYRRWMDNWTYVSSDRRVSTIKLSDYIILKRVEVVEIQKFFLSLGSAKKKKNRQPSESLWNKL